MRVVLWQDLSQASQASHYSGAFDDELADLHDVLEEFDKKFSSAEQDLASFCKSSTKAIVAETIDEWDHAWLYHPGNKYKKKSNKRKYTKRKAKLAAAFDQIENAVRTKFQGVENALKLASALATVARCGDAARKAVDRGFYKKEAVYLNARKAKYGPKWQKLRDSFAEAQALEQTDYESKLGGDIIAPSGIAEVKAARKQHARILSLPTYNDAQSFLSRAQLEAPNVESLLNMCAVQARVAPGYGRLARHQAFEAMKQNQFPAAKGALINCTYRLKLWDVEHAKEWKDYCSNFERVNVDGHTSKKVLAPLLSEVPYSFAAVLASQQPFEYYKLPEGNRTVTLNASDSRFRVMLPEVAHSVFGYSCSDPARNFETQYSPATGISLLTHPRGQGARQGEAFTYYGATGGTQTIASAPGRSREDRKRDGAGEDRARAEEDAEIVQSRSERGDFSHRHAVYGASGVFLCGRFITPFSPEGAGAFANHPVDGAAATLKPEYYVVKWWPQGEDNAVVIMPVLVLTAAENLRPGTELTHKYVDRFPAVPARTA